MKKFYSALGAILGFLVILFFAFENAQAIFEFTFDGMDDILYYIEFVRMYLVYALAGLAGMEFVAGKKVFATLFFLILAFVVVSTFFPAVLDSVM